MTDDVQKPTENLAALERRLGAAGARAEVARLLREFASVIERDEWPALCAAEVPAGEWRVNSLMPEISVTLSHPWPG